MAPWGGGPQSANTPRASTLVGLTVPPKPRMPRLWIATPWSGQCSGTEANPCLLSALTSTWKLGLLPTLPHHPTHHLLAVLGGFSLLLGEMGDE